MQSVILPGTILGLTGLCALSGVALAQGYPEWGGGYPGRSGAYPYPYGPSYGYGPPAYSPGYPLRRRDMLEQPPVQPYSNGPQAGSHTEPTEPALQRDMAVMSEEERAARARFEARRRAMEERRQALRAAIEELHIESRITPQPSVPSAETPSGTLTEQGVAIQKSSPDLRARPQERRPAAEVARESGAMAVPRPEDQGEDQGVEPQGGTDSGNTAEQGAEPVGGANRAALGGENTQPARVPGALEGTRSLGDAAPLGLGMPRRSGPIERRAALEARRQAIQQRRDQMKAAFEQRRRAARTTVSGLPPAIGPMSPPSTVEPPGSGDADTSELEGGVEKRRAAGEPAPMGLGLSAPEPASASPEG